MVSVLRYHEISEGGHRILNPMSDDHLDLVGEICSLRPGMRQLDLACGKGEMLCRFAARHGTTGVGVDISTVFIDAAVARARELAVDDAVRFVVGDASDHSDAPSSYDVVSCIGASWIGGGLAGTLELLRQWLKPGGWLLAGEPYWIDEPPAEVRSAVEAEHTFADLAGTLDRFEAAGVDLVEMVLSDGASWDRYAAHQWLTVADWLRAHPDDPDAAEIRAIRDQSRRDYLAHERRCVGWGVFVLRAIEGAPAL